MTALFLFCKKLQKPVPFPEIMGGREGAGRGCGAGKRAKQEPEKLPNIEHSDK